MRIATVYYDGTSNAHYRVLLPLSALERRGHKILWPARHSLDQALAGVPNWDVYHMQQFFHERDIALVKRLRGEGIAVVWDSDDDILAIPKRSPAYARYGGRRGPGGKRGLRRSFERTVEMAREASLMTTPSPHLAQVYRDAGVEHVEVVENYIAAHDVAGPPRGRRQGVVIGLVAAFEHLEDIEALGFAPLLERLLAAHPSVRVVTYGPDLRLRSARYLHRGQVPIGELVAAEREFDIGLAPLTASPFGLARSNVKVKEYAAAGAMWLASPVGPFRGLGEEQGGLLVEDDAWYATLEELVLDGARRAALAARARAWARRQSIEHASAVGRWETLFRDAVRRARAEG